MKEITVFSFGAGVQSTTILIMICKGEIPKPDLVVFADTGWEPQKVYDHLEWCIEYAKKYNVEIKILKEKNIKQDIIEASQNKKTFVPLPFFVDGLIPIFEDEDEMDENQMQLFDIEKLNHKKIIGYKNKKMMLFRQCTNQYKIKPIRKYCRDFLGLSHNEKVKNTQIKMILGISTDEIQRVKPSDKKYILHEYPLIKKEMSREDCLNYIKNNGINLPPKSACIGCPFNSDKMWMEMKKNDPESFQEAIYIDEKIRNISAIKGKAYMHRTLKPLKEINFEEEKKQMDIDFFINECTGHCGV